MSNNPILPIRPDDDEPVDDDEGTDSEATVERDLRDGDSVNENIDE